jgi:MOSC domain-containing protein YiiM
MAVSTGRVYVYDLSAYRHWEQELGGDDFVNGQFGENFTVEGLPDDEVCIGDHYGSPARCSRSPSRG